MPRNRPVDYPSVPSGHHPIVQPQLGLAPPQPWTTQNRFSWQDSSRESGDVEQQLEAGNAARQQEKRQSRVPPLPVLPEHLAEGLQQQHMNTQPVEAVLPSQRSDLPQPQLSQTFQPQPQPSQFRPDIPRLVQQQQLQVPHQGIIPSYEASQAAHHVYPQDTQASMQEQAVYPGHFNVSQAQLSSHALPMHTAQQAVVQEHLSSEQKPEQPPTRTYHPEPVKPVSVGPDVNPLSPHSPTSATSPSYTTNMQTFPPPAIDMSFPPSATFGPGQSSRGGTWHHGLGSCAEPTTCLSSLFCPCVVYGRTQYRLSLKSAKKDTTNMLGYSSINGSCLTWSVLCGVNILLTAIQHTRVRKAYEMDSMAGNVASDCVKSICCCCCVIAQDEKEMKVREEKGRKTERRESYKSPEGMTFGPPR